MCKKIFVPVHFSWKYSKRNLKKDPFSNGNVDSPQSFKVKLGAHFKGFGAFPSGFELMSQQTVDVESIHPHPDNNAGTNQNDFAILKLKTRVKRTKFVSPVCLPGATNLTENTNVVVTGWGTLQCKFP